MRKKEDFTWTDLGGGRSGVLEEIADKQGTLLEVKRVLNDDGLLALPLLFAP
jgi:hypothetical protein